MVYLRHPVIGEFLAGKSSAQKMVVPQGPFAIAVGRRIHTITYHCRRRRRRQDYITTFAIISHPAS